MTNRGRTRVWFAFVDLLLFVLVVGGFSALRNLDPGEFVFLYVFENLLMAVALMAFYLVAVPFSQFARQHTLGPQHRGPHYRGPVAISRYLVGHVASAAVVFTILVIGIVVLDQITVQLLVDFVSTSGYDFTSVDLLGGDAVFVERSVTEPMRDLLGVDYWVLLVLVGGRFLVEAVFHLLSGRGYLYGDAALDLGLGRVIAHAVTGPACMFAACIVMVILTRIFDPATWIILLTLLTFRVAFVFVHGWLDSLQPAGERHGGRRPGSGEREQRRDQDHDGRDPGGENR